jgi:hypothetical protein
MIFQEFVDKLFSGGIGWDIMYEKWEEVGF